MNPLALIGWLLFAWVLFRGMRYLLVVRMFLTYAYRDGRVTRLTREQLEPGQLELLSQFDESLAAAGFKHLGFAQSTPVITYYDKPIPCHVFVNEVVPAYAFVRPNLAAEYGALAELQIQTTLESGISIATYNTRVAVALVPPDMRVAGFPDALPIETLVDRHQYFVARASLDTQPARHTGLEDALERLQASLKNLRTSLRNRGCTVATSDSSLDRFTLSGAFALTRNSFLAYGGRVKPARPPWVILTEKDRQMRVAADLLSVESASENPATAPGTPWPLITVIVGTALLSWLAMGGMWNFEVATVILAAVAFHEAGHAMAMRLFGYQDVQIFFVPLVGALTVGRAAVTSVRDRLVVLLAGPTPGLWLGLLLAVFGPLYLPALLARVAGAALLVLNGLNLLPFTPLDGGRAMEVLTRAESPWRMAIQVLGSVGLFAMLWFFRDPVLAMISLASFALLPRQWQAYQLRRAVAAGVHDRTDSREVARVTLETLVYDPRYHSWRSATRVATARALGRTFAESVATPADRLWGGIAYASAWIPLVAWFFFLRTG